ncbi:FAD-dependent monooxygenase [Thermodesulfobacteriota bacterium]
MNKDVAIIGGSAAGLYTASLLSKQGLQVKVFEESENIDPDCRTLIVTNDVLKYIDKKLYKDTIINKIRRFELFANGRVGTISLQRPDLIMERNKLIQRLADQAEENGAKLLTGRRFLGLRQNGKRLKFDLSSNGNDGSVEDSADVIVGADGVFSKVAQSGGWSEQPTVPLFQAVVELPEDMPPDTTRVWFIPKETPYFYWLIPHSPTHGVLGLIGNEEGDTKKALENFLEKKKITPIEIQDAHIPRYTQWVPVHRKMGGGHVYLVGDAAGHVKVTTVGGLFTGFRGARGVAEAILNGGSSREFKGLRRELNLHHVLRRMFNKFTQHEYVRLLDLLNPSAQKTLGQVSRDETPKLIWHLFRKQPRLLFFGLKTLLFGR